MNSILIVVFGAAGGCLIGVALAKRNRAREAYYGSLIELCAYLETNLRFKEERTEEVLGGAEIASEALKQNIREYISYINGGELKIECEFLNEKERDEVKKFFSRLGKFDAETELNELHRHKAEFERRFALAAEKNKSQSAMYIKLGSLMGILVGILLI